MSRSKHLMTGDGKSVPRVKRMSYRAMRESKGGDTNTVSYNQLLSNVLRLLADTNKAIIANFR